MIRSSMNDIPQDRWEKAFGNKGSVVATEGKETKDTDGSHRKDDGRTKERE